MFDELFEKDENSYEEMPGIEKDVLINYVNDIYNIDDDEQTWFSKVKEYADKNGFTSDRKAYKENPNNFKGTTADFCKAIRIVITKKNQSPNLYDIIRILGTDRLIKRINLHYEKN